MNDREILAQSCCNRHTVTGIEVSLTGGTTLGNGESVVFNTVNNTCGNIIYDQTLGTFTFTKPGDYFITYMVNVNQEAETAVNMAIMQNGVVVSKTGTMLTRGCLIGFALITVNTPCTSIQLINNSGTELTYDTEPVIEAKMSAIYEK